MLNKINNQNLKEKLLLSFIFLSFFLLLLLFTKGNKGNHLYYQTGLDTKIESPFELSNTTARYALTKAIVERGTFFLTQEEARFSAPDVVDFNGKFISIFTPGVSLVGIPLYYVGKLFGYPQIFAFLTIVIIAFINIFLITKVSLKLGAGLYSSILSGIIFAFATNALGYTMTFTQHQLSVMLILLAILNALKERTWSNNILFGTIVGAGALVDIPNLILMFPIGFYVLAKHIQISRIKERLKISLRTVILALLVGILPLIILFAFYNYSTSGSFTRLAQDIGRTHFFRKNLPIQDPADESYTQDTRGNPLIKTPFNTRNQLNGLYILGISNERSWLFYSPILFLGILGLIITYKNKKEKREILNVFTSIVLLDYIIYSMFGDPWGGWSFGPRYLIPAAAIMSTAIGVVIQKFRRNHIFMVIFLILLSYSVFVNTLGVLTTNAVAPKVEAVNLKTPIHYTYKYNLDFVNKNQSSNLIFNLWLRNYIDLRTFWYVVSIITIGVFASIYLLVYKGGNK